MMRWDRKVTTNDLKQMPILVLSKVYHFTNEFESHVCVCVRWQSIINHIQLYSQSKFSCHIDFISTIVDVPLGIATLRQCEHVQCIPESILRLNPISIALRSRTIILPFELFDCLLVSISFEHVKPSFHFHTLFSMYVWDGKFAWM